MGLTIFIGEVELDDGEASIKLIPKSPEVLSQHPDNMYANHWSMGYTAQQFACREFPWFREVIGENTYIEPKPLSLVPAPYGEVPPGWLGFVEWFTFWRGYSLANFKNPAIRLA